MPRPRCSARCSGASPTTSRRSASRRPSRGPCAAATLRGLEKHLATLRAKLPSAVPLYLAAAEAQLPLARAIGDAPVESFDEVERVIVEVARGPRASAPNDAPK